MTKRLRIHSLAEDELADAAGWYESRRSGLGIALLDLVDEAVGASGLVSYPAAPFQV